MYNMKGNYYKLLIENKLFVVKNKEVLARPSGYNCPLIPWRPSNEFELYDIHEF